MQLKPENSKWERGVFPTINFFFQQFAFGGKFIKNTAEAQDERRLLTQPCAT